MGEVHDDLESIGGVTHRRILLSTLGIIGETIYHISGCTPLREEYLVGRIQGQICSSLDGQVHAFGGHYDEHVTFLFGNLA